MSFVSNKKGIMKRIKDAVTGETKDYTLFWDRDLFKGYFFLFPASLFSSATLKSNRAALEAFVSSVTPKKLERFRKTVSEYFFDFNKFRTSPEWSEFLTDFTGSIKEVMVRPGEAAVISWKGKVLEVVSEGVYSIPTKYREQGIEVALIQTTEIREFYSGDQLVSREGLVWGLAHTHGGQTTISDDPKYSGIKVKFGGNGTFLIKIVDPQKFFTEVIQGRHLETASDLVNMLRGEIQNAFIRQLGMRPYSVIMDNFQYLGEAIVQDEILSEKLAGYGIKITEFFIKAIMPDPSRKEFIDKILYGSLDMEEAMELEKIKSKQRIERARNGEMKFCLECGAELPAKAKFCIECGEKLST